MTQLDPQQEAPPQEPGITEQPFSDPTDQALEQAFGGNIPLEEAPPEPGGGEEPPVPAKEEAPPTAEEIESWTYDDGVRITKDQARQYAEFAAWLEIHPDVRATISGVLSGEADLVPRGQPSSSPTGAPETSDELTPPPELDLDDPATRAMWEQQVALHSQLREQSANYAQLQESIEFQQRVNADTLINRAKRSFAQQHDLDDAEMDKLFNIAAQRVNLQGLVNQTTDPVTGAPVQPDPLRGLEEAFSIAQWSQPDFRDKEIERRWAENRADTERKSKLNALGGTGGGTPRPPAPPKNEQERREQMAREIAEATSGNFVQPE